MRARVCVGLCTLTAMNDDSICDYLKLGLTCVSWLCYELVIPFLTLHWRRKRGGGGVNQGRHVPPTFMIGGGGGAMVCLCHF